jgi:hypothetical protein
LPFRLRTFPDPARGNDGSRLSARHPPTTKETTVAALLLVLLLILILFGLGFAAVKFLIWVAIILAIVWLIGFFMRGAEGARWYRW